MCNNNGHCRKFDAGTMCPSFRATGDEQDLTRGRANTLRLALSGQLGSDALTSASMYDTLSLCVSCKGCKRECPTGVDMARMKIEFLHHHTRAHGVTARQRIIAHLPRYAPWAARFAWLMNLRDTLPGAARLTQSWLGLSAKRRLPRWKKPFLSSHREPSRTEGNREVVLLADTFNNYFEPDNLEAACEVLEATGYQVNIARAAHEDRPLCCGRTFLSAGLVDEARAEAQRMIEALQPFVTRGVPVIGLEPSCLFTLRDEWQAMFANDAVAAFAEHALLFEEFLDREKKLGRLRLPFNDASGTRALLHGHCHQKAFNTMSAVEQALRLVPGLAVEQVASSCCGMAGAFGYEAEHFDVSMRMAEASLLPAVRKAAPETTIVADGTSCRHQIHDGTGRAALHVAQVLRSALQRRAAST